MTFKYLAFLKKDFDPYFEDFCQVMRALLDDFQVSSVSCICFRDKELDEAMASFNMSFSIDAGKLNAIPNGLVRIAILGLDKAIDLYGKYDSVALTAEYVAGGFWAITSVLVDEVVDSAVPNLFPASGDSRILIVVETSEGLEANSKVFKPEVIFTDKKIKISDNSLKEIFAYISGLKESNMIPPFQSSRDFPRAPRKEDLPGLYSSCFQALKGANRARRILRYRMDKKKQVISEIQNSIQSLECDLLLEAEVRQSLHIINERLLLALREMEGIVDDFDRVVEDGHRTRRSRLVPLIKKLKDIFVSWREFQRRLRWPDALLGQVDTDHQGKSDG